MDVAAATDGGEVLDETGEVVDADIGERLVPPGT